MRISQEGFKISEPFSKRAMDSGRVYKHLRGQQNKSLIGRMLSKGSARGSSLIGLGANKKTASATIAGMRSRLTDPTNNIWRKGTGAVTQVRNAMNRGLKTMGNVVTPMKTAVVLGTVAMAGVAFMNGAMNQANDIMMERYMRDARYGNRMLSATSLGQASGNSPLSMGNHTGLSLALSRTRHGH